LNDNSPSKRILILISFAVLLLLAIISCGTKEKVAFQFDQIKKEAGWTQITENIFVSTEKGVNITLVVSGKEATVIDTGYQVNEAKRIKDYLEKNGIKLKYVIITHLHPDHTANQSMFKEMGAAVYMPPKIENALQLSMGKEKFKIIHTPGHAGNSHFSVEIINHHFLVAGDVITNDWLPYIEGTSATLLGTLKMIQEANYKLIIPGHGELIEAVPTVQRPLIYLEKAKALENEGVHANKPLAEIQQITIEECNRDLSDLREIS